ncbi:uncharacterized protein LOC141648351 [Silene latifolia]|uniref:uncharacterized protein LOC141648351 n=1 Tax=Silene latifolia TaxID=37657 RepID=UPI003D77FAC1
MANTGRTTRGRQRVALERMQKDSNRSVTFAKRRGGVFKKISELVTLCGVQALCIVFSAANKAFAYGHPSVEAIINRFLAEDNNLPQDNQITSETFQNETILRSNMEVTLLKDQIDMEKKRTDELLTERKSKSEDAQKFLEPAETFTYSELKQIQATLNVLKNNVLTHGRNLEAQSNMSLNPNPSPSILDGQNSQEQNPFLNPPNMLVDQNYNPNPTLVQSHTTPTFGESSHMTMVPPPLLMRNPNDNIPMAMIPSPVSAFNVPTLAMRSNFMSTEFTHPNIPQAFHQGHTNLNPGPFYGQNTMLADMGWNPMPRQTFTNLLMGEGSSNSPALPFNPQSTYVGGNPIPGANFMGDGSSNYSAPPFNPQGPYMGNNPIPGDYQTFRNLMGEGSSNPSNPPFNPQGGFGFGPEFDPGMN